MKNSPAEIDTELAHNKEQRDIEEILERIFEHFPELREILEVFIIEVLATNQEDSVATDTQRLEDTYAKLILQIVNPSHGIQNLQIANQRIMTRTLTNCAVISIATIIATAVFKMQQIQYATLEATILAIFVFAIQYNTIQYNTIQYNTIQYNIKREKFNPPTYTSLQRKYYKPIHKNQELASLIIQFYLAIQRCLKAQQENNAAKALNLVHHNARNVQKTRQEFNNAIASTLSAAGALIARMQTEGLITNNGIDSNDTGIEHDPLAEAINSLPKESQVAEVAAEPVTARTSR